MKRLYQHLFFGLFVQKLLSPRYSRSASIKFLPWWALFLINHFEPVVIQN
jgi:hypothetical protein